MKYVRLVEMIAAALSPARAEGFKEAINKTTPGWRDLNTALRMIRDAVEELGPVGAVPSRDVGPPDYIGDANDIITGVTKLVVAAHAEGARQMRDSLRGTQCDACGNKVL